jgi:thioredoxin-dependent peroxiredoxin
MVEVGKKAPPFTLKASDGNEITLSDFIGKTVVLYFYPKDNTPGCTKEACSFRDNLARVKKKGAVVLGVSADTVKSHKKFTDDHDLNFPLLSDEDRSVLNAYGVWKKKTMMGKAFMGVVRTTFIINPDGIITHIFPNVKVDGHVEEILKVL